EGRRIDLITVQDTAYLALLAYLLARRFRIPFEVQVHGLEKFFGIRELIAGFVLRRADKIRVVSERLKRDLATRYTLHATRFYMLPVYTQIESLLPARLRLDEVQAGGLTPRLPIGGQALSVTPSQNRPFTFLTVGRLVSVKNIEMQIRAVAELVKKIPHIRLRIVGDGAERANLQLTTNNLQLEDKVIFEGEQRNVSRFYAEADAFLLTSDYEGWGLTVTEAAAYGLPIIMTDTGLAHEFIKQGENGIVIPVGDEEALASAMKQMIADEGLRARLGEAALRSARALPKAEEQIVQQAAKWREVYAASLTTRSKTRG
ncbi:MAG: group 1 glycosyl transferase, partial [Parcubacteria group bacterium Greene0416_79]